MNGYTYTKESVTIVPLLQKGSVIPEADLPTTEIIEPKNVGQNDGAELVKIMKKPWIPRLLSHTFYAPCRARTCDP